MTVSRSADRLIAVKQVPAERAGDIEREAGMLKRLHHPGVVRFVDAVDTPGGGRALHTEFVSSDTWATRPLTDPAERAAGVAALAAVVADLHDLGIAHCQLSPAHVLHGEDDRPVLCGLRLAAEASLSNRHGDLVALADLCHDPGLEGGPLIPKLLSLADATRAGRLSARELARRLDLLLAKRSTAAEPIRAVGHGSGGRLKNRSRRRSLMVAGALLAASAGALAVGIWSRGGQATSTPATIIDGAEPTDWTGNQAGSIAGPEAAEASHPPGSDAAATGDTAAGPAATGDTASTAAAGPAATGDTASTAAAGPAATGDTAAAVGLAASPAPASPTLASPEPGFSAPMVPGTIGRGFGAAPDRVGGSVDGDPGSVPSGSPLPPTADFDDRGLPETPAGHETGAVLEHGGHRYVVGAPGDFVQTGDWDCDGQATPVIVRPSTGDVVLFDAWPTPNQSISMPVRWQVEAPTGAEAVSDGSCDLLRVYTTAGSKLFDPSEGQ